MAATERRLVIGPPKRAVLEIEGQEYAIRWGIDVDMDVLAEIARLQNEFRRFGNRPDKMPDWNERAKKIVLDVIRESGSEIAHLPRGLSPSECLQILAFIAGSDNAQEEIARAIESAIPEELRGEEMTGDPQTSTPRSRSRRRRSDSTSRSEQPTGDEDSDGESSSSTSQPSELISTRS
jgi:hypothetical protein